MSPIVHIYPVTDEGDRDVTSAQEKIWTVTTGKKWHITAISSYNGSRDPGNILYYVSFDGTNYVRLDRKAAVGGQGIIYPGIVVPSAGKVKVTQTTFVGGDSVEHDLVYKEMNL